MRKLSWISKADAEKIKPTERDAIISIREPAGMVDLSSRWKHVLELEFHDADGNTDWTLPCYTYDTDVLFDEKMAKDVYDFVKGLPPEVENLIVHCHMGISRSAAIAIALHDTTHDNKIMVHGLRDRYMLHNKHVWRTLSTHIAESDDNTTGDSHE